LAVYVYEPFIYTGEEPWTCVVSVVDSLEDTMRPTLDPLRLLRVRCRPTLKVFEVLGLRE
jgi:hypothetical protein